MLFGANVMLINGQLMMTYYGMKYQTLKEWIKILKI